MKKIISLIVIVAIVVIVSISVYQPRYLVPPAFQETSKRVVGGVPLVPSYNTASSTLYSVGADISTQILAQKGSRGSARICNDGASAVYLSFGSTAILATTSADTVIQTSECFDINQDNLYVGAVQAMQDTGTTTTLFVTELLD
jgi:hypothetical protein